MGWKGQVAKLLEKEWETMRGACLGFHGLQMFAKWPILEDTAFARLKFARVPFEGTFAIGDKSRGLWHFHHYGALWDRMPLRPFAGKRRKEIGDMDVFCNQIHDSSKHGETMERS